MAQVEAAHLAEAAARGIDWILAQQRDDGSFCDAEDGVGGYYKVPYALSLVGRTGAAQRLLDWVAVHHFSTDGDFRAPERKALEPNHENWPVYANAWLILGAHRLGRWDLSLGGMEHLLRYQVPAGGFYALDGAGTAYLEPVCTSWGAMAALTTGHLESACRAGDLLAGLAEGQPHPDRFYFRMDIEGALITDVPAGAELAYFVDSTQERQIYYHPGIALICLSHLARATGDPRYRRAAQSLFEFTARCAADVHRFPPSGKLGLGCALLYAATGTEQARRAALEVGSYLVETQTAEGYWRLPAAGPYVALADLDGFEIRLDVTTEFSAFLWEMASLL